MDSFYGFLSEHVMSMQVGGGRGNDRDSDAGVRGGTEGESVGEPKGGGSKTSRYNYGILLLCNVKRMIKRIVMCNRTKDDCNLLYIFSSFVLSCFCFQLRRKNNHDCLEVMQSLYYKSSSKHILKSVRHRNREGYRPQKEHYNINTHK